MCKLLNTKGLRYKRGQKIAIQVYGRTFASEKVGGQQHMLWYAWVFLVIAIIAAIFGFGGIAVAAAGIAKICFVVFLVLFLISLLAGRRSAL